MAFERQPKAKHGLIDCIEFGDCWTWTGRTDRDGYGRYGHRGQMAHRIVWELLVGPIPTGLHVDHRCRNKLCVNPDHLEPVTPATNIRRTPPGMKGRGKGNRNQYTGATHCKRGHEYTEDNTAIVRNPTSINGTRRQCLKCRYLYNHRSGIGPTSALYCKYGHPRFGPESDIYVNPDGVRQCRICRRRIDKARSARRRRRQ